MLIEEFMKNCFFDNLNGLFKCFEKSEGVCLEWKVQLHTQEVQSEGTFR